VEETKLQAKFLLVPKSPLQAKLQVPRKFQVQVNLLQVQ
jgi:hypothetical protein